MISRILVVGLMLGSVGLVLAQDESTSKTETPAVAQPKAGASDQTQSTEKKIEEVTKKLSTDVERNMEQLAKTIDQDQRAKDTAAGILQPIYVVAEALAFPAFHWVAFALMAAGVVSFALQLVLGKLVVLTRLGFSLKEIMSDLVGLAISVVGLVLTTQAAAENSTFTQSAASVLSASLVGVIGGFVLYGWGQAQELDAAAGRSRAQQVPQVPQRKR